MNAPTDAAAERRNALVEYAMHYGPRCRECADHGDVCPMSGMACGERRKATEFVVDALIYGATQGYCPASLAPAAIRQLDLPGGEEVERLRVAYKTGHNEGYIDATDDGTGNGYPDHQAAEEGWQQYKEKINAEAIHCHAAVLADGNNDLLRGGRGADVVGSRGAASAMELVRRLVRPMVQERSRENGDAWDQADDALARLLSTIQALTPARVERSGEGGGA